MAWTVTHSVQTLTDGHFLMHFKQALVAAGWSVASSGDGASAYDTAGNVHGAYATLDTANAWMRLRGPVTMTPRRELLIQKLAGAGVYRCLYSSDGIGFVTGGNATTRPTAADEQSVINVSNTSRALPWAGRTFADFVVGDENEGWSFLAGAREFGNPHYSHVLFLDVLLDGHPLDQDQAVVGIELKVDDKQPLLETSSHCVTNKNDPSDSVGGTRGWHKKGLTGATWTSYPICLWGFGEASAGSLTSFTGSARAWCMDEAGAFPELDAHYMRGAGFASEKGFKGRSRLFRIVPTALGGLRPNSDSTRLAIGSVSIPWGGGTLVL